MKNLYFILLLIPLFSLGQDQTLYKCNNISSQVYSVDPEDDNNTFEWSVDGPSVPVLSNELTEIVTIDWTDVDAGTYTLSFTETSLNLSCDGTVTYTVQIIDNGSPNLTINPVNICEPETSVELIANVTGGASPYTFDWGQEVGDSSLTTITLDLTLFDINPYLGDDISEVFEAEQTISVTDANGCETTLSITNIVDVYPIPEPSAITAQ